ncbi:MAG: electron transfer flavoprotein subunit alpha/FixB family protein [Gammaproteobacteria bacterium]
MSILVIAEHDNNELKGSTLNTVTAASEIGGDVSVLVVGSDSSSVAEQASKISGINSVIHVDDPIYKNFLAEDFGNLVTSVADGFSYILAPATTFGKNFLPRVAAKLDVQQISDIISVEDADTFKRPIYAGSCIATVKSTDTVKVITVRTTAFDASPMIDASVTVNSGAGVDSLKNASFVSDEIAESDRPELTAADVIVSGGRALGSSENFEIIEALADKLGAAVGASRAAVDAGYVPNDYQVGQTGKIVAPNLYIAIGISGAIQHLAGMKDSKVIVAINKDEDAPIFQVADYGLVGDLFEAVPELTDSV